MFTIFNRKSTICLSERFEVPHSLTIFDCRLEIFAEPLKDRVEKGYKEVQMSIIAGYNDSDWTEGWSAMLDGFSLFINSRMEETLSKVKFVRFY